VFGAATNFQPGQHFTRANLAQAIRQDEGSVFSWIRQLGRPEKKFGMRVFVRHEDGSYTLSPQMREAVLRLAGETNRGT
jgi:hypothetical protein